MTTETREDGESTETEVQDVVAGGEDGAAQAASPSGAPPALDSEEAHAYLKGLVEALLFVAEAPLSLKELARAAKIDKKRTEELLTELRSEYAARGINIQEVAGGFCFRSSSEYASYVRGHLAQRPVRLSRAQLETLAIIAYRQPITRPDVDEIRGVDSGPVLKGLLERDLVKILGKKDEPGRPMLYGTSMAFLELFNMQSLQDLPTLKEFTELSEESRKRFENQLGEDAPEGPIDLSKVVVEGTPAPPPVDDEDDASDTAPDADSEAPSPEPPPSKDEDEDDDDEDGEEDGEEDDEDEDEDEDEDDEDEDDDDDED